MPEPKKRRQKYTPQDRDMALACLDGRLRGLPRIAATETHFKEAAAFADVPIEAIRFWVANEDGPLDPETAMEAAGRAVAWDGKSRPMPPLAMQNRSRYPLQIQPAPDVTEWAMATFIKRGGERFNQVHSHLAFATIGFLWSNYENTRNGDFVAGTTERPPTAKGKRPGEREDFQLRSWFGCIPHFLITLDSVYWADQNDLSVCSLTSHELGHCGQQKDAFKVPKWTKKGPVFCLNRHTAEEFDHVVEDYGLEYAAKGVAELVAAAQKPPRFADARSEWHPRHCGTCGR